MLVFLMYDNENYIDLERILSSTLNDMSKLDTEFLVDVEGSSVEAISLMRLVCYEKHRDIYRFFFQIFRSFIGFLNHFIFMN